MNKNLKTSEHLSVVSEMLRAFPLSVSADIYKFMEVTLSPGENIKQHKHRHHLVMYYPEEAGSIIVTPQPGTLLYLPPGTLHEVPAVTKPRRSIAMLVSP